MKPCRALPFIVTLGVSACSQLPTREISYDPGASTALNVVRMAGLEGMSDRPADLAPRPGRSATDAELAAAAAARPQPGISPAAGAALGALSLLGDLPVERPTLNRHVFAWIPIQLAETAENAGRLARTTVQEAIVAALDPDHTLEERTGSFSPTLAPTTRHRVWVRPGCPAVQDRHRNDYDRQCSSAVHVYLRNGENLERERPAPPFLGVQSAVRGPIELGVSVEGAFAEQWRNVERLPAISRNLPAWIFIYAPPGRDGTPPRVYVRGDQLFFQHP